MTKQDFMFERNPEITVEDMPIEDLLAMFDPVTKSFFEYYVLRAHHDRAVNFVSSWTATTPWPFFQFPLMSNIRELDGRPVMFVAGENAHSRYYSEDAYEAAAEPKELVIVKATDHADLYDQTDKIPFAKRDAFFKENLG